MREINDFNEIPELFPWEPTFSKVIITLKTDSPDSDLELSNNTMSEVQYIVKAGPSAKQYFNTGDKVLIDLEKMLVQERSTEDTRDFVKRIKIDPVEYNGITYGIIEDRFIKAKYIG